MLNMVWIEKSSLFVAREKINQKLYLYTVHKCSIVIFCIYLHGEYPRHSFVWQAEHCHQHIFLDWPTAWVWRSPSHFCQCFDCFPPCFLSVFSLLSPCFLPVSPHCFSLFSPFPPSFLPVLKFSPCFSPVFSMFFSRFSPSFSPFSPCFLLVSSLFSPCFFQISSLFSHCFFLFSPFSPCFLPAFPRFFTASPPFSPCFLLVSSLFSRAGNFLIGFLSESLDFCPKMSDSLKKTSDLLIRSFLVSELSDSLTIAHFLWAMWANRS